MRTAARVDANQSDIVHALRKIGCSVQHLHAVGDGCPDLLAGRAGKNYLLEVKDGSKPPSDTKLTKDQAKWHIGWRGLVHIVYSVDDAIKVVMGK